MKKHNISRQDFLKKTAAGALGVMVSGALAGCSNAPAASTPEAPAESNEESRPYWMPEAWDYEADVIICGFGGAGAMAAREVISHGDSCLVFEKAPEKFAGGATACCAGVCNGGVNPERDIANSLGYMTYEAAENFGNEKVKVVKWLEANGLEYEGWGAKGFGYGLYHTEADAVMKCGPTVVYEMDAKHLVFDPENKEVYGVVVEDANGKSIYAKANKGVLLATGNFVESRELMYCFMFPNEIDYAQTGSPYDDGNGLRMGMEIGAALMNMNQIALEYCEMAFKKASEEIGTCFNVAPSGPHAAARMYVNQKGQRFMKEDLIMQHYKGVRNWQDYGGNAMYGYSGWVNRPFYVIFDSQIADEGPLDPCATSGMSWSGTFHLHDWSADNQQEVERGWLVKADTLEELVKKLAENSGHDPIDLDGLKATIAEFNQMSENGTADPYGRDRMLAINKPPYYAAEVMSGLIYTMGGLKPGMSCETLDWNGNPIPRLYHAGDVGQFMAITSQGTAGAMAAGAIGAREICGLTKREIAGTAAHVVERRPKARSHLHSMSKRRTRKSQLLVTGRTASTPKRQRVSTESSRLSSRSRTVRWSRWSLARTTKTLTMA